MARRHRTTPRPAGPSKEVLGLDCAQYPDQTVLAVGHGIVNKAIQSVYTGKPMNQIQRMENAEVRRLEL